MTQRDRARHTCHIDGATACRLCMAQRQVRPDEYADSSPHEPVWSSSDAQLSAAELQSARQRRANAGRESRRSAERLQATRRS